MTPARLNAEWQDWIGREARVSGLISPDRVADLAATLDVTDPPGSGAALPAGWHWLFFNPFVPGRELGPDGHARRGGFLPPVGLPRRMWAGGRLFFPGEIVIGAAAERHSAIRSIATKSGRSGALVFVTVTHRIVCNGTVCLEEEQDIVFREDARPGAAAPARAPAPDDAQWQRRVVADATLLFRYSALTSNGHRIHYDQAYARTEEHYPDLVVHGPLTATLLQGFAQEHAPGATLLRFAFRGVHPLFVGAPFTLCAKASDQYPRRMDLWAAGPSGELAMRASAEFAP